MNKKKKKNINNTLTHSAISQRQLRRDLPQILMTRLSLKRHLVVVAAMAAAAAAVAQSRRWCRQTLLTANQRGTGN